MEKVSSNVDSNYTSISLWQDESESLSTTKKVDENSQIEKDEETRVKEKILPDFSTEITDKSNENLLNNSDIFTDEDYTAATTSLKNKPLTSQSIINDEMRSSRDSVESDNSNYTKKII